jgi:tRNA(Ile)-lysidine synthetase-like protein
MGRLYFSVMPFDSARGVLPAVRLAARETDAPLLLAVSGGLDSMVLLHAMASAARDRIAGVVSVDHRTGLAATRASTQVASTAAALGLPVAVVPIATELSRSGGWEAAWRRERYRILREAAGRLGARVVTAHTEDDQIETVLMRLMRGSGARGLAGLLAPSDVVRPFLSLRRGAIAAYAREAGVRWVEDPSNASPRFLRNRVRRDLLPALRRVDPTIDAALLGAAREAAVLRAGVERFVDSWLPSARAGHGALVVASVELAGFDRDSLAMLWGSLAARVGLTLDRRGTRRLAAFTSSCPRSGTVPLSGGWCLDARGGTYVLERPTREPLPPTLLPDRGSVEWGRFRFRTRDVCDAAPDAAQTAAWTADLLPGQGAVIRGWDAGDRLAPSGAQPMRRVKRYLSDAGIRGRDRTAWPVVVTGEEVVWIPGVRRSDAATERSGRPVRHYVCERIVR